MNKQQFIDYMCHFIDNDSKYDEPPTISVALAGECEYDTAFFLGQYGSDTLVELLVSVPRPIALKVTVGYTSVQLDLT